MTTQAMIPFELESFFSEYASSLMNLDIIREISVIKGILNEINLNIVKVELRINKLPERIKAIQDRKI